MDVYLKKRWDLIPNLVNTVKGYAAHEAQTLQNVVTARAGSYAALSTEEKLKANAELSGAIAGFSAVVEQYPDLKANQNFWICKTSCARWRQISPTPASIITLRLSS